METANQYRPLSVTSHLKESGQIRLNGLQRQTPPHNNQRKESTDKGYNINSSNNNNNI